MPGSTRIKPLGPTEGGHVQGSYPRFPSQGSRGLGAVTEARSYVGNGVPPGACYVTGGRHELVELGPSPARQRTPPDGPPAGCRRERAAGGGQRPSKSFHEIEAGCPTGRSRSAAYVALVAPLCVLEAQGRPVGAPRSPQRPERRRRARAGAAGAGASFFRTYKGTSSERQRAQRVTRARVTRCHFPWNSRLAGAGP